MVYDAFISRIWKLAYSEFVIFVRSEGYFCFKVTFHPYLSFLFFDKIYLVKDELVAVRPYLRKSIISTLQEKIDKERKKLFHLECSDNDDENFMIVQELEDVAGTFII